MKNNDEGTQDADMVERIGVAEASCMSTGHHLTFEFILGKGRIQTVRTPLNDKAEADLVRRSIECERRRLVSKPEDDYRASQIIQGHKADAMWLLGISEDEAFCWKVTEVDGEPPVASKR